MTGRSRGEELQRLLWGRAVDAEPSPVDATPFELRISVAEWLGAASASARTPEDLVIARDWIEKLEAYVRGKAGRVDHHPWMLGMVTLRYGLNGFETDNNTLKAIGAQYNLGQNSVRCAVRRVIAEFARRASDLEVYDLLFIHQSY